MYYWKELYVSVLRKKKLLIAHSTLTRINLAVFGSNIHKPQVLLLYFNTCKSQLRWSWLCIVFLCPFLNVFTLTIVFVLREKKEKERENVFKTEVLRLQGKNWGNQILEDVEDWTVFGGKKKHFSALLIKILLYNLINKQC